ncbi:MAG: hypothetical protein FWC23_07155 [Chitinispirillia bacterium]|nr:hypothetical protein [Chitinispirillia bacterium]MCL2268946.1 hypothetical protein [Chitinispirillia bacterium]
MGKGRISTTAVSLMLALICAGFVDARNILFLGLTDSRGEPAQPHLEQALRNKFATNTTFGMLGDLETQRVIREIERQGRKRTETFLPARAGLTDSTIVIRGIVEENTMAIKRRWGAWSRIDATLTVEMIFKEVVGAEAYEGRFSASASKNKNFVLFGNPQKLVHISAVDRAELTGVLHGKIVNDVAEFATHWFKSMASGPVHKKAAEEESAAVDSAAAPQGGDGAFPEADELMTEE